MNSFLIGLASFYSIAGCLGCSSNFIMANGERLNDSKLTVAYNRVPLNSYIGIINRSNLKYTIAKVTDRGGYEKHGKIIDLSLATKNILGCKDICYVEIIR